MATFPSVLRIRPLTFLQILRHHLPNQMRRQELTLNNNIIILLFLHIDNLSLLQLLKLFSQPINILRFLLQLFLHQGNGRLELRDHFLVFLLLLFFLLKLFFEDA